MSDKSRTYVREKLAAYVQAWATSSGGFPYVIVAVPDDDHKLEIEGLVAELDGEDAELFKVCTIDNLVKVVNAR